MRRYIIEFTLAMGAYFVVLFGTRYAFATYHGPWYIAIALAPAVPIYFVFVAGYRLFRGTDEFAQRLIVESLAIAGVVVALVAATYGFLESDILPRPSAWWVWMLFMTTWGGTSIFLRIRYR